MGRRAPGGVTGEHVVARRREPVAQTSERQDSRFHSPRSESVDAGAQSLRRRAEPMQRRAARGRGVLRAVGRVRNPGGDAAPLARSLQRHRAPAEEQLRAGHTRRGAGDRAREQLGQPPDHDRQRSELHAGLGEPDPILAEPQVHAPAEDQLDDALAPIAQRRERPGRSERRRRRSLGHARSSSAASAITASRNGATG